MTEEERKAANREKSARYRERHREKLRKTPEQKEEIRKKTNERYQNDPEFRARVNEANRKSKEKHAEKVREANRKYDEQNREKNKLRQKVYYKENRERILKRMADKNAANPEIRRERLKKQIEQNPEAERKRSAERRAFRLGIEGTFSKEDIRNLFVIQFNSCLYCKADLTNNWHIDHRIPISRGGTNWPSNLQLLCRSCNMKKSNKDPDEYEKSIGYKK